jgi:dTDP-4-amino-4,6-dideoxygalactose transaminase
MERIPVFVPHVHVDTVKHLLDALDVGWLGMGATTKEFEERIAEYLELEDRHVVATNTGTSALHIGLILAGVGPGDEVITPSFNYVADHQAIRMAGGDVVMCDIRDDNLGMDCEQAEALISTRTKAILPLHFAGIPCDRAGVFRLAEKRGLRVVEDAMHAFGTELDGQKIGRRGDVTCFSFDPVKIITSIDGGCVVVNDVHEKEMLHRLRFLGVDKDTAERYKNRRAWQYDVVSSGFRYHLTNIMASVGVSQIKRVDEFIGSRREVCEAYNSEFRPIRGLRLTCDDFRTISPFIYSVRVLDGRREELITHLSERGVDVGIHFLPVHEHTQFADARRGPMEVTGRVAREVLTLPLHSNMKTEFVDRVIEGVTSFFG